MAVNWIAVTIKQMTGERLLNGVKQKDETMRLYHKLSGLLLNLLRNGKDQGHQLLFMVL